MRKRLLWLACFLGCCCQGDAPMNGDPIAKLVADLESQDVQVRRKAAHELLFLGPQRRPAAGALIKALRDNDHTVRYDVVSALAGIDDPAAIQALVGIFKDKSENDSIRRCAAASLGAPGVPTLAILTECLKDADIFVRRHAANALHPQGREIERTDAIPALIAVLDDNDVDVRSSAMESLTGFGNLAAPLLTKALSDNRPRVQVNAACALLEMNPADPHAIEPLIEGLQQPAADVRRIAAWALSLSGVHAKRAVPSLTKALEDKDVEVRRFTTVALREIGPEAKAAVPALARALLDVDLDVCEGAASALVKIGPAAKAAVPALVKVVRGKAEEQERLRETALLALGEIGPEAKDAVPVLQGLIEHLSPSQAELATIALRRIRGK